MVTILSSLFLFPFWIVDEMEKYVVFNSYSRNDNIVKWLFEILREFDENMKAKYLFYILGNLTNFEYI